MAFLMFIIGLNSHGWVRITDYILSGMCVGFAVLSLYWPKISRHSGPTA